MKKSPSKIIIVSKEQEGSSLVDILQSTMFPHFSKRVVKRGIDAKGCLLNHRLAIRAIAPVAAKTHLEVFEEAFIEKEPKLETILFEDEHLIIYDKPAGVVCDLPMQVHRLDKETSGIYLVAKDGKVKKSLEDLFRNRLIQKEYRALVAGEVQNPRGRIESYLQIKREGQGQKIWGSSQRGVYACTDWQLLERGEGISLLRCLPKTGRMHQLRVHLSEMRHPIIGDYQYGRAFPVHALRHLLHATRISFQHPITRQRIVIESPCAF